MTTEQLLRVLIRAVDAQRTVLADALQAITPANAATWSANLVGRHFGALTVIARAPSRRRSNGKPRTYWLCHCSCGATVDVRADRLRHGAKSCGCQSRAAQFKSRAEQRVPEQRAKRRTRADLTAQADTFAESLRPLLTQAIDDGCSLVRIADRLNAAGVRPRLGGTWTANVVYGVLARLGLRTRRAYMRPRQTLAPAPIERSESQPASQNGAELCAPLNYEPAP